MQDEEKVVEGRRRRKDRRTGVILHSSDVCLAKSGSGEQRIMGLRTVSLVMWGAVVDTDSAYLLSLRKLSLAVKVRSHTHIHTHAHPLFYLLLGTQLLLLSCLFLHHFFAQSFFIILPFSPPDNLISILNYLVYFCLFISLPLFLYLCLPDVRLLFGACYTCTAYPCPRESRGIACFFYLEG